MTDNKEEAYQAISATIKRKIQGFLGDDTIIHIVDDSDSHAGHLGRSGYLVSHLRITVISDYFSAMNKIARQRLMHKILDTEIKMVHSMTFLILTNIEAQGHTTP